MKKILSFGIFVIVLGVSILCYRDYYIRAATFGLGGMNYVFYEDNDNDYDTKKPSEVAGILDGVNAWGKLVIDGVNYYQLYDEVEDNDYFASFIYSSIIHFYIRMQK